MTQSSISMGPPPRSAIDITPGRKARPAPMDRAANFGIAVAAAYIILKMYYIFNEGNAQPADIMLAALSIVIASPIILLRFLRENTVLLALLSWIAVVNVTWALITAKLAMTYFVLFYLFNIMIVVTVYSLRLRNPERFDTWLINAIRASIVLQLIAVILDPGLRALGTFQNPNQLAYWGIAILSIFLVLRRNIPKLSDLPFLLMALYCVFASLSRAGLLSCLFLVMVWAWFALRTTFRRLAGGLFLVLVFVGAYQVGLVNRYIEQSDVAQKFENRLETKTDTDLAEGRNYDRITNFYQYTVLGAGEGFYARFEPSNVVAIEIHSTFATMLFSYGIVGLSLFVAFLWSVIKPLPLSLSLYLAPSLVYSITHQGLRFTFFWVLIGVMMAIGHEYAGKQKASSKRQKVAARPPELREWRPRGPKELQAIASGQR